MSHSHRNYNRNGDFRRHPPGSNRNYGQPFTGGDYYGNQPQNYDPQPVFPAYGSGHQQQAPNYPAYQQAPPQQFGNTFHNGGFSTNPAQMREMAVYNSQQQEIKELKKKTAMLNGQLEELQPAGQICLTIGGSDDDDPDDIIMDGTSHPIDPTSTSSTTKASSKKDKKHKHKKHGKKHRSKSKKNKRKSKKSRKRRHSSSSSSESSDSDSEYEHRKRHKNKKRRRRRSSSSDSSSSSSSSSSSASGRSLSPPRKKIKEPTKIVSEFHISKNKWILLKPDKWQHFNPSHIVIDDRKDPGNLDMPANPRQTPAHRSLNSALNGKMRVLVLKTAENPTAERYFSRTTDTFFKSGNSAERCFRRREPIGMDGAVPIVPLSSMPLGPDEEDVKLDLPQEQFQAMTVEDFQAYLDAKNLSLETSNLQGKRQIYRTRCNLNRHDIDAWLNLIRIQRPLFAFEEYGDPEASVSNMRALREVQTEILNKAIAANPTNVQLALERVKTLFADDARAEWRRLKNRFVNDPKMWQAMITMKQNQRTEFKYSDLLGEIDNCLMHLVDIKDGIKRSHPLLPGTERFLVEKLVHRVRIQRDAGFFDAAITALQALTEFHFFAPKTDIKPSERSRSRALVKTFGEEFFTPGKPRIGEADARGWCNSRNAINGLEKAECEALEDELVQIDAVEELMIDGFKKGNRPTNTETWRRVEILRSEQYWRPVRFVHDEDCETYRYSSRFTSFADLSKIFFTFDDQSLAEELVFRVAQTLGAVIPGLEENEQSEILRQFAGGTNAGFPRFETNYRDLISFFDNYFDLLATAKNIDQDRVRCAKIATRAKYSIDATPAERRRRLRAWSQETLNMVGNTATKAMCFLEIAKCYELLGDSQNALRLALMILQGNESLEMSSRERAIYLEVVRWVCRRLPFDHENAIVCDTEEAKPDIANARYTPKTKLQLLFAWELNGTLNKTPAYNDVTRTTVRDKLQEKLKQTTFEPADWFTNENETVAELGLTLAYESTKHHVRTCLHILAEAPCSKALGMTAALWEAKIAIMENKMSECSLVSPANRNEVMQEAILAHPTHVGLLKKFIDTCRRFEVRKFLLLHPGDDWPTRRIRSCGLIYMEWLNHMRIMDAKDPHKLWEKDLRKRWQEEHSFLSLRLALETAAQQTTIESDLPDAYVWCLLMKVEQDRNSPIRRIDEIFVLGQDQCPWSKTFLLEATRRRSDASGFATQLTAILSQTHIQKYTSYEEEIDSLYEDPANEDDDDDDDGDGGVGPSPGGELSIGRMAHNFDSNVDFGDRRPLASPLSTLRHPIVTLSHVGFRSASILFYVFANVLSSSFIVQFLIILSLLSADFWAVKNVTGRLMVGLRWWNFVDEEGRNHWKFESSKTPDNYDPMERRIFWGALTVAPVFWLFLVAIAFFTFQWQWMVVAGLGLAMSLPNLYGYLRCKWSNTQEVTNYLTKWALFSMFKRTAQQQQAAGAGLPTFTPQMTATI